LPDTYTERLNIRKIQPTDYFISDTFNAILDDIDAKVLGIDHLDTALHWTEWKKGTAYERNDVVRWVGMKSHQYAKCLTGGISGTTSPGNNVTGSVLTEGTVTWKVMSLTEATDTTGPIVLWLGGTQYSRGDVALYANALYRSKLDHTASGTFEPDEAKWAEIYASIRPWSMNKYYYLNDTVIVDNIIYKCNTAHTSKSTFDNVEEVPTWTIVGNLARAMEWQPNTYYLAEQLITKNGLLYRAIETHTSDGLDFTNDSLKWEPVFASIIPWTSNAWYDQDVVVSYNNILYRCVEPHTSSANFNYSKWQLLHDPNAFIRDWVSSTQYYQNQVVRYNGNLYRCNTTNNDTTWDITKWTLLTDSINDWVASVDYVVGQYVNYKGSLYKCIAANNDANFTTAKWQKVSGGGIDTWTSNNDYSIGDIVVYNNKIYSCNTGHTSGATFIPDEDKWTEISACITRISDWEITTDYVVGDLVAHDAKIYRCITAHTSSSTWDATEEAKWEELSPTINEISTWTPSTDYAVGQLVIHNNKLYRCNTAHTSDSSSFNTDIAYWDEIGSSGGIEPWKTNELYAQGNMVVYNDKIYICDTDHTSANSFDSTKWHEISSSDIDNWQTSTDYVVGDMVVKDDQLYRCITQHTSDSSDFDIDISNWQTLDTKWKAVNWNANTLYIAGEVLLYNNTPIKCTTTHISASTYELDKDNWETLSVNIREWVSGNSYKAGDTVIYENEIWKCTTANNSNSFEKDKWSKINKCNIEMWRGAPDPNVLALLHFDNLNDPYYNEYGDNFTYSGSGGSTYLMLINSASGVDIPVIGNKGYCLTTNSFGSIVSPEYEFTLGTEVYTIEFFSTLPNGNDNTTLWSIGGIGIGARNDAGVGPDIFHGVVDIDGISQLTTIGSLSIDSSIYWHHFAYILSATECILFIDGVNVKSFIRANSDSVSFISEHGNNATSGVFIDELMVTKGAKYISDFTVPDVPFNNPNFDGYKVNDLVVYNDKIYRCIDANNDVSFTPSKWVEVSKSIVYPDWSSTTDYNVDDIVIYQNQLYRCIISHTSTNDFNGDFNKWTPLDKNCFIHNWASNIPYYVDEVVKYDDVLYRCKTSHVSTLNDKPSGAILYEATGSTIDIDDTTTIPYSEIIDLDSVKRVTDIDYTESTIDMSFTYTIEVSEDNVNYTSWDGVSVDARYIRLTVDSVNIDAGATSPNAHLADFTVYGDNDKWEKISFGGSAEIVLAREQDIDEMFI